MYFFVFASFLLAVWFCIYTHAQFEIVKFQDSVYIWNHSSAYRTVKKSEESRKVVLFYNAEKRYNVIKTAFKSIFMDTSLNVIKEFCSFLIVTLKSLFIIIFTNIEPTMTSLRHPYSVQKMSLVRFKDGSLGGPLSSIINLQKPVFKYQLQMLAWNWTWFIPGFVSTLKFIFTEVSNYFLLSWTSLSISNLKSFIP